VRVAFVAPFFGAAAAGGAESEARNTALRLAASGLSVDVLTTCLLDLHHDWTVNYHRRGVTTEAGLTVRRFRVEPFDLRAFGRLNVKVLEGGRLTPEEERQFISMHVNSYDLYRYLAEEESRYDWICFIPYLFGTTYFGSIFCPDKAVLIPCLHDEGYARMSIFAEMAGRAAKVVFHTGAERELARRLFGLPDEKALLIGEGVETSFESDGERFRRRYGIEGPFVLYAGRKSREKNVHTLVKYFSRYARQTGGDLRLVMIGPGRLPLNGGGGGETGEDGAGGGRRDRIVDLGFLPEQDKRDAYSAATVFCQPSLNESFSIVIMESWACGVPCLVHADCAVTREHVTAAGGGLYFGTYPEFEGALNYLLGHSATRERMGEAGKSYIEQNFAWERIIGRYRSEVFGLPV
jgi:glycosyltransferase involved in cell wall biosynthesis